MMEVEFERRHFWMYGLEVIPNTEREYTMALTGHTEEYLHDIIFPEMINLCM